MAEGCEKGKLWDEWLDYLIGLKENIQKASHGILKHTPKVFLVRKNRHILETKGLLYWRYIALEEKDIEDIKIRGGAVLEKEQLQKLFATDIFGKGFITPAYKLTDLMQIILLKDYFQIIDETKIDSYVKEINKLIANRNFKHYCKENDAKKLAEIIGKIPNYKAAIRFLERESLLKGYENGISIMFPISVGAFYILSVFLSFKNNFIKLGKSGNFWKAQFAKKYKPFLVELYSYFNQIPMLMLTKLYSLFFSHEPTIEIERLIKKGLSVMMCIPEKSIAKKPRDEDWMEIERPFTSNRRKLFVPYPVSFDRKKIYRSITIVLADEISKKLSELYQNIISAQKKLRMKDAVVAIMGRNMSHNIGSHVLANVTQLENDSFNAEKAKKLFKFLQQRMDFIAQVSTTTPTWTFDIKLKEIIDGLNSQIYLKDFIADFRGLKSDDIEIIFENEETDKEKAIAIPIGGIGCHALFSIIENIIRNAARHGMQNGQNKLKLSITVDDNNWRFYKITVKDNCGNGSKASDLNSKLSEFILDDRGQLRAGDWGMKEKKILACYLRLIAQEDVDDKYRLFVNNTEISDEPSVIKTLDVNGDLAYQLFLLKPKKALIVSNREKGDEKFRKEGFDFVSVTDFEKMDRKKIIHKFLIIDMDNIIIPSWVCKNILNHINKLPFRIFIIGNITNGLPENVIRCSSFPEMNGGPDKFYEELWGEWTSKFYGNNKLILRIDAPIAEELNKFILCIGEGVKEEERVKNPSNSILLDHLRGSDKSSLYKSVACHIPFGTEEPLFSEILQKIPDANYLICELIEMGITKVAIVDDRIWKAQDKSCPLPRGRYTEDLSKKLFNLWERKAVDIIDTDNLVLNFKEFVNSFPNKKYHFLIFHQGEIQEIKKRIKENEFKEFWNKLKTKVICTLIDTGRGTPEQALEDNLRWLPYSLLQECVLEKAYDSLAKKRLIDHLMSSRAEEKGNE
ncbi:MAG: hypothetical protein AB1480_14655 [Nitrospirota bacterium]